MRLLKVAGCCTSLLIVASQALADCQSITAQRHAIYNQMVPIALEIKNIIGLHPALSQYNPANCAKIVPLFEKLLPMAIKFDALYTALQSECAVVNCNRDPRFGAPDCGSNEAATYRSLIAICHKSQTSNQPQPTKSGMCIVPRFNKTGAYYTGTFKNICGAAVTFDYQDCDNADFQPRCVKKPMRTPQHVGSHFLL